MLDNDKVKARIKKMFPGQVIQEIKEVPPPPSKNQASEVFGWSRQTIDKGEGWYVQKREYNSGRCDCDNHPDDRPRYYGYGCVPPDVEVEWEIKRWYTYYQCTIGIGDETHSIELFWTR